MIQCTISTLSEWVKQVLWLSLDRRKKIEVMSTTVFWKKLTGRRLALVTIPFKLWIYISHMVECPYCLGFWGGLALNYFYFKLPVLESLLLAPFVLIGVAILDKLHSY